MARTAAVIIAAWITASAPLSNASPDLNREELESVVAWVDLMLQEKNPEMSSQLVGTLGAMVTVPYGIEAAPRGSSNSREVVEMFRRALRTTTKCLGYNPTFGTLPDKAILYVSDLRIEPTTSDGIKAEDVTGLVFFRINGEWELVWLKPIVPGTLPSKDKLVPCGQVLP